MQTSNKPVVANHQKVSEGSLTSYVIGFLLSVVLTIVPFMLIINEWMRGWTLLWYLVAFATLQLLVQLVFFLHIGKNSGANWNITAFLFMVFFLLILVVGSLWVMHHLDYNMMTPELTNEHMKVEADKGF